MERSRCDVPGAQQTGRNQTGWACILRAQYARAPPQVTAPRGRSQHGDASEQVQVTSPPAGVWDAACPISTGRGTRRVHLVRVAGRGGVPDPPAGVGFQTCHLIVGDEAPREGWRGHAACPISTG